MKWQNMISEGIKSGVSDDLIAKSLFDSEEIFEEIKSISSEEIFEEIKKIKDLLKQEKKEEVKKVEKEAIEEKIDIKSLINETVRQTVDEAVKSVNINNSHYSQKIKSSFNFRTGKIEAFDGQEYKKIVNDLVFSISMGDSSSAKSINEEIESSIKATTTGYVSDVSNRGGYLVPSEYETMINSLQYGAEKIANLMTGVAVTANSRIYPIMSQLDAAWRASQSEVMTESQTAVSQRSLDKKNLYILSAVSNQLLRQRVDVSEALAVQMAEGFARKLDTTILCGAITADSDGFNGLTFDSYSRVISSAVDKSDFARSNLDDIFNLASIYSDRTKLVWLTNTSMMTAIKNLKNASGQAEFPNAAEGRDITPCGIKLVEAALLPNVLDFSGSSKAGGDQTAVILCDTSNVFIDRGGISIAVSDQNKFNSDMTVFRGIRDVGLLQLFQNKTVVLKINAAA